MKEAIRTRARELGFDDCRFATATRPVSSDRFTAWIASDHHGEMGYLRRNAHKRVDPQQVLPGAMSVVCVAMNYAGVGTQKTEDRIQTARSAPADLARHSAPCTSPSSGPSGRVARYARYVDYHEVMGKRLRELTRFVAQVAGSDSKSLWYVDTGPVLEREFAERAGIGFVGKHTNLISRNHGNWILLGEILTTLELEPDTAEKNRCGRCARCIQACPTEAITGPFQLDARRCISYLTIELKGSIPAALRPAIGNRIFGCDDCLEVCPWNRFAVEATAMKSYRRQDLETPALLDLLALDNAEFKARFRGTPIERSKRRGLLRNVCVALGNSSDPACLPALQKAATDAEPLIAEHAQWALERVGSSGS